MHARRHASCSEWPKRLERADREDLGALDAAAVLDPHAVLEHDPRRDDRPCPAPSWTPSPIAAPAAR